MVCDWCHTPCDPEHVESRDHLTFHPECLWAFEEHLRAIKEESDAQIRLELAGESPRR